MITKKVLVPAAVVVVSGVTFFGASQAAHAQTTNPMSGLVQAIAQKFNLDQNQVQSVVDQYREQHKADRQKNMFSMAFADRTKVTQRASCKRRCEALQ